MNKAFTLIELLVVVLIIGILSSIALPQYGKAVDRARRAEAVQMLHQIHRACQLYELEGNDCGDNHLLENSDIAWPSEPTTENCWDVMCVNSKDWQYVDNTGGDFLAVPQKNLENPPYVLGIHVYSGSSDTGRVACWNHGDNTACQKICGSAWCYLD